jgi:hypothetical protein
MTLRAAALHDDTSEAARRTAPTPGIATSTVVASRCITEHTLPANRPPMIRASAAAIRARTPAKNSFRCSARVAVVVVFMVYSM